MSTEVAIILAAFIVFVIRKVADTGPATGYIDNLYDITADQVEGDSIYH